MRTRELLGKTLRREIMKNSNVHSGSKSQPRTTLELRSLALVAAFVLCFSVAGWAQDQATITGPVTDNSGAVVPNVKIVVSNPDKGFTRETVSNTAGDYTVAKIPIGSYQVTAEGAGFQKLLRTDLTLSGGPTLRVDLQLRIGQVTQEVTVVGQTPKV